ncbi:uncharacterized protein LOC132727658 [Ruditapes philippinarum]|uniref:uncharacterized protein LOC132727658 n=1 Tax=Ruditapes philippinarum TaxID=129788 RepID=UPI00295BCFF4|nr:uncharacterized protein LOC132727658 [Ruditapes philippinarum]
MKTSRSSVYPVVVCSQESDIFDDSDSESGKNSTEKRVYLSTLHQQSKLRTLKPTDHAFDQPDRRRTKARRKLGVLTSNLDAPPKGTLPMRREYHKCDESKVLPNKRSQMSDINM